ncbi:MAG: GIY-YIG nuclease family protein [Candidatus Gastranaerophilales bacterium]|nr:GIY-YIG nuclease family protein [Candidatus Gastranaerophilales bacterium]
MTKQSQQYYIYIITNKTNTTLYTGVTNDLIRRIYEHKNKLVEGFSNRYNLNKLLYYEICDTPDAAITREKQIKGGSRKRKEALIINQNPKWEDLYERLL